MTSTSVIIPALDEEETIVDILAAFTAVRMLFDRILVVVDSETTDDTFRKVSEYAALHPSSPIMLRRYGVHGKGNNVKIAYSECLASERILLCDADYKNLRPDHILTLTRGVDINSGVVVGVPEIPTQKEWEEAVVLNPKMKHAKAIWAIPWVSGFRNVPLSVMRVQNFHGYLLETQINKRAGELNIPVTFHAMRGLISPLQFSEKRLDEMEEHRQWGIKHGVFQS